MKIKSFKEISKGHALIENPEMLVQFEDLLLQTARRFTLRTACGGTLRCRLHNL